MEKSVYLFAMSTFRFTDHREERIYRKLGLVGPGAQGFFRDACLMMQPEVCRLESTTHMVAHALREIESSLRDVLEVVASSQEEASDTVSGTKQHHLEIDAILQGLGLDATDPISIGWHSIAHKFHAKAHRSSLSRPRPLDDDFREMWEQMKGVLDTILDRFEARYLNVVDRIDEIIKHGEPSNEDITVLKDQLPNNLVTREYLFSHIPTSAWLVPLRKAGFFNEPPEPVRDEVAGTIQFPGWPAGQYLARVASELPEPVQSIIASVKTENARILDDFADAALAMPARFAAKLVPQAIQWLQNPYYISLGSKLGKLLVHLSSAGFYAETLLLLDNLLAVREDPLANEKERTKYVSPQANPVIREYDYEAIVKQHVPTIALAQGLETIEVLCRKLEEAITLSRRSSDRTGPEDYSYITRPTIEGNQEESSLDVQGHLISAIRDASIAACTTDPELTRPILQILSNRQWYTFARLAMHLLLNVKNAHEDLVVDFLLNKEYFGASDLWHEYSLLLSANISTLSKAQHNTLLEWMVESPELGYWRQKHKWWTGEEPTDDQADAFGEHIIIGRFARLGEAIPRSWQDQYPNFTSKIGTIPHPTILSSPPETRWGHSSPASIDDIGKLSIRELTTYLNEWQPSRDLFADSKEGLAEVLRNHVSGSPERYTNDMSLLLTVKEPVYISAIVRGLHVAVEANKAFGWDEVISFLTEIVSASRGVEYIDPKHRMDHWRWCRQEVASLLELALGKDTIPMTLRRRVWRILVLLSRDPNPSPEHEREFGGNNQDPFTMSLNTVRGRAFHAVLEYALWVKRFHKANNIADHGFSKLGEVKHLFNTHLVVANEPSLTVRSIYGARFNLLVWLAPRWSTNAAALIFSRDPSQRQLYEAAWSSYLTYGALSKPAVSRLHHEYMAAVNELKETDESKVKQLAQERLADHIMLLYYHGEIGLNEEDGVLATFLQLAPDKLRAHAVSTLGYGIRQDITPMPHEFIMRIKEFWTARLTIANKSTSQPMHQELAAFGTWFALNFLDTRWSLERLIETLRLAGRIKPYHLVLERLVITSDEEPRMALDALDLLVKSDQEDWEHTAHTEAKRTIIANALRSKDAEAADNARRLVNRLVAQGQFHYRELL
jgi:hypothetical protein